MDRTSGEVVMVTPAASDAICAALTLSARNLQETYATLTRQTAPLKATWGPSATGTVFYDALTRIGNDIQNLSAQIAKTSKTVSDNTAQGLALAGLLRNLFTCPSARGERGWARPCRRPRAARCRHSPPPRGGGRRG